VTAPSNDIAAAIAASARTMHQEQTLDETLQAIVRAARNSVPGFDQVGISTLEKRGKIETRAITGDLVQTLDRIQYDLGEGPCYDSLRDPDVEVVTAPNIRHDQRWPRYVPAAVAVGLRSQLAVKLYVDGDGTLGGLNFYSTTCDDIDPDAEAIADLFAAHAAIALENAKEREQLNEALHSRKVVGQALGIIMERYDMNEDRAFAFLVRASSSSNIKLRDIAQELVDKRNGM
jgi:GAF domain-containing protein